MENPERAVEILTWLKTFGASLALDDFGTGYCSLSYLHRFPCDTIKVDKSLVRDSGLNGSTPLILRSIIALSHELGKRWWLRAWRPPRTQPTSARSAANTPKASITGAYGGERGGRPPFAPWLPTASGSSAKIEGGVERACRARAGKAGGASHAAQAEAGSLRRVLNR